MGSDCYFQKEMSEAGVMIDPEEIQTKMKELEKIIDFRFKNIKNLANAMCAVRVIRPGGGLNASDLYNESLATVGDAVLKLIISARLYGRGKFKGEITEEKKCLESNDRFHDLNIHYGLYRYAFNGKHFYSEDLPDHEKVPNSKHNQYLDAIVGAMYFDSGFDECKKWYERFLAKDLERTIDFKNV